MTKKQTSPELTEVYESGVAVVESVAEEKARLTAEIEQLEREKEPVRTVQLPVLSMPGGNYEPAKLKRRLEIAIAERRIRLSEIVLAEAEAKAVRIKTEAAEVGDVESELAEVAESIKQAYETLRALDAKQKQLQNRRYTQGDKVRDADRAVMRAAGELEHWQKALPEARERLAQAEEAEANALHNRAEERARQSLLAG